MGGKSYKIFGNKESVSHSPSSKSKKKAAPKVDIEAKGREALDRLNPMVIPLLAAQEDKTLFVVNAIRFIHEMPHRLTDKFIDTLNKWAEDSCFAAMLDEPDIAVGNRHDFFSLKIVKIVAANMNQAYPMPAIIVSDDRGWKWYFKTSKAYDYEVGNVISFSAKVSAHKEGISFLKRPTKIRLSDS